MIKVGKIQLWLFGLSFILVVLSLSYISVFVIKDVEERGLKGIIEEIWKGKEIKKGE